MSIAPSNRPAPAPARCAPFVQPRLEATWGASTTPSLRPVPVLLCWSCCLTAAVRYEVLAMICCMPQLPAAHCVYFHGIQRQFIAQYNIGPAIMHCNKLLLHRVHAFSYSDASASDSSEERSAEVSESKEIRQWRWYQSALRGRSPVPLLSG